MIPLLTAERAERIERLWEQLRDELAGELDAERDDADERDAVPVADDASMEEPMDEAASR